VGGAGLCVALGAPQGSQRRPVPAGLGQTGNLGSKSSISQQLEMEPACLGVERQEDRSAGLLPRTWNSDRTETWRLHHLSHGLCCWGGRHREPNSPCWRVRSCQIPPGPKALPGAWPSPSCALCSEQSGGDQSISGMRQQQLSLGAGLSNPWEPLATNLRHHC
jgi:hypothetical protein